MPWRQTAVKSWKKLLANPAQIVASNSSTMLNRNTGRRPMASERGTQMNDPMPINKVGAESNTVTLKGFVSYEERTIS
jgi:hypothetical protein